MEHLKNTIVIMKWKKKSYLVLNKGERKANRNLTLDDGNNKKVELSLWLYKSHTVNKITAESTKRARNEKPTESPNLSDSSFVLQFT